MAKTALAQHVPFGRQTSLDQFYNTLDIESNCVEASMGREFMAGTQEQLHLWDWKGADILLKEDEWDFLRACG